MAFNAPRHAYPCYRIDLNHIDIFLRRKKAASHDPFQLSTPNSPSRPLRPFQTPSQLGMSFPLRYIHTYLRHSSAERPIHPAWLSEGRALFRPLRRAAELHGAAGWSTFGDYLYSSGGPTEGRED